MKYVVPLFLLLVSIGLGAEDTVRARALKAVDLYEAGQKRASAEAFQKLANDITREGAGSLTAFVIPAPKDVKRSEPRVTSGTFGMGEHAHNWQQVQAIYTWLDGMRVKGMISTSNQLVQAQLAMAKMYDNPQYRQMMEAQGGIEFEKKDGWVFITQVHDKRNRASFMGTHEHGVVVQYDVNRASKEPLAYFREKTAWSDIAASVGASR